ncbi:DUF2145 domain-containing protein, partial [Aquabacterium sp.]|uniref:DUF2145 domain-containing protein n=1 Tax=Aquabacterium sp. TaxID=1872578 RepID=UPI003784AEB5
MGAALLGGALTLSAQAASLRYCDRPQPATAAQQDRLLRLAARVKAELEAAGQPAALLSRSGLDLSRFGQRYSHAGVSLRQSPNTPWSVRQLYYACDEGRPRLYDQGLAGFLSGGDDPELGFVSIVLLPPEAAAPLERSALDGAQALALLGGRYSANAYPFSTRYQNCNQWVMELLAAAWHDAAAPAAQPPILPREAAQQWLRTQGFTPTRFTLANRLWLWAAAFVPWVHDDDHPPEADWTLQFDVSMPPAIEAFVHAHVPGAQRLEFCHRGAQGVLRRGWAPLSA